MAIRIPFDAANNPESPTVVLAKRNGEKIGQIDAHNISVSDSFNDAAELSFQVYKELNGEKSALWDEVTNFKLVYCLEWNQWFEITVELDESNETVKTVFGTELGYAELGQINLYNIEINTEEDIARDDYKEPTVLFDETNPKASLLHRIMEKAPHYTVTHVDASIAKIQRSFSFDDESIMDAFQDIAEEIKCIFIPKAETDGKTGELKRTIEVYDLQNYCPDCGHRWDSVEQDEMCPECGKKNVKPGYGDDTTIFITSDELADDIGFETDTDAVKNCFKLEGGDDLMTATIRNCNPNGTDYLWYFSDDMKHEMPKELVDKIESYDELYEYYQKEHVVMQTANAVLNQYNQLVDKYTAFNEDLEKISVPIVGYPALMNAYYNTIDFNLYLTSSMMPSVETMETDAHKELTKLNTAALSPVAVQSVNVISNATADNAVLSMARLIVDTRFKVTVNSSTLVKGSSICTWTGSFTVTNYYDEEDTATGGNVVVTINENYVEFVRQKIEKQLSRDNNVDEIDIVSLFEKDYADFVNELRKYSLNRLKSFQAACQAVLDILVEQGIADKDTWSSGDPNLYDDLYYPYYRKLGAIESEISLREQEISVIVGVKDADGDVTKYGLQNYLDDYRDEIHDALDFEKYMGEQLWLDFCAYRREDKYSNDNFISDALDNKELFDRAQEFIEIATQEIHKSAEQQHSISSDLKNLLVINKFKPLVDSFGVGNWLRVMVDDTVYKLRLIQYSIDYDDIENISVEFSDVIKSKDSASDIQSVLEQASSMATSYDSIKRQAADGKNASNMVDGWVADGLDLTNMMIVGNAENQNIEWGERGLLAREYLPITDTYDDRQLKLINRGLYVTSDGWETARAGIGNFMFWNPKTKETEEAYGVIADTIVGNIILSEEVGIYNKSNSITMDGDGFTLTTNADGTDPENIFTIQKEVKDQQGNPSINKLLYVDSNGNLTLNGAINVVNSFSEVHTINDLGDPDRILVETNTEIASIKADLSSLTSEYTQTKQTVSDLGIETQNLNSKIEQTASSIRAEVSSSISTVNGEIGDLSTKLDMTAGQLRVEITSAVDAADNAIDIVNGSIKTVDVEYGVSNSPTVEPTSWSTNSPQWQAGKYIWQRTKTTTPEGVSSYSKAVCIQGAKGQDGINGTDGKDGVNGSSSYFHVAYANSADGSKDFSTTVSANKQYIGTYVDNIQNDSNDHTKYSWTLIKGADGKDGIAGTNGKDGTTYYLHIAYANDANGKDFSTTDGANKKYIGQCVNTTQADPNTHTSYTWSLFKGADGTDGLPGKNGKDGTSSYVHIKYSATMPDSDDDMTETPSEYIGICTDQNPEDPTTYTSYKWSKLEGTDGTDGLPGKDGDDGTSSYVHFAYSTSADGKNNFSTTSFDGALYIGVLTDDNVEDSGTYTDYAWSRMRGEDGAQGIPGESSYIHIKYSSVPNPSDSQMLETPNTYIGICIDSNIADPTTASSYTWSKFEGKDGTNGLPGKDGEDGKNSYVHFAYSTTEDGSGSFSTTSFDGAAYLGVLTDDVEEDSTDYRDYTWSLIKGRDGIDGTDGKDGTPGAPGKDGVSSYVHIKYSAVANPTDSQMTETPNEYIGICTDQNQADPTTAKSYTWSKFEGKDGTNGIQGPAGKDGASSYVHFAYSTTADGSGSFSVEPFDGAKYIGVLTNSTKEDSQIYTDYTWSQMRGDDGANGKNGDYITDIFEQYYLSTSATKQEGGSWSTTQPAWSSGHYIWTRSEIHWIKYSSEGDPIAVTEYTDPVLAQAINGANENASYVRGFMEYDATGLTIGRYNTGTNDTVSKVKLASTGRLEVYNGNTEVAYFGSTARIGTTSGYNTYIDSSSVKIRYGTTALSEFGSSYARIGKSNGFNTYIDSNSVDIKSGNTVLSTFTGDSITLGASSKSRMILGSSGLDFYQQYNNGSLHALSISASGGDVPSLTINNVCGGYFYLMSGQTTVRISGREFRVSESTGGEMLYLYGYNEQIKIFGNALADWVTSSGNSGSSPSWRYRTWKSGRKECFAEISMSFPTNGERTSNYLYFPFTFTDWNTYYITLQLMNNTGSDVPSFNNTQVIPISLSDSRFRIRSWTDNANEAATYRVAIHVFGW